jgi:NhaP-type Na+/H+ or K+/H+ antiporter
MIAPRAYMLALLATTVADGQCIVPKTFVTIPHAKVDMGCQAGGSIQLGHSCGPTTCDRGYMLNSTTEAHCDLNGTFTMGTVACVAEHGQHGQKFRLESNHAHDIFVGGHTSNKMANLPCRPVVCDDTVQHHRAQDQMHCQNVSVWNYIKNATEVLSMTCGGCVPHTCSHNEHDCKPVICEVNGELHGGYAGNPCEQGHHDGDGLGWWPFLLLCLLLSVVTTGSLKKLAHGTCCGKSISLPFTAVMFFIGYIISSVVVQDNAVTEKLVEAANDQEFLQSKILFDSVLAWKSAHPHVILFVLLPPLLFEDAASMDYYVFRKVLLSSILLAGPGVLLTMGLCALTTMLLFGFANECMVEEDHITHTRFVVGTEEWQECKDYTGDAPPARCTVCQDSSPKTDQLPVSVHLLLGGMLAATDPVAVCAVLNDLGCPDKLNYMIAGESLLNDGTAVVAFLVMQSVAGGCDTGAAQVSIALLRLAGGGVLWGMFMAACAYQAMKHMREPNVEITITVFCTFTTFWMAENILGVSGVLGTVVFGVQTARTSLLAMDHHSHHASHAFWSEVGYVATSIIFILAGVKSRDKISRFIDEVANNIGGGDDTDEEFSVSHQLLFCFLLWIALGIIRALVVMAFSPILKHIGYGLTWKEAVVMVWGGLRGAVSLSLALLVDGNHLIGDRAREMIFLQTTGIVTLTLVINGTTAGLVYKALEVYPPNPFRPALATQGLRNLQLEMDKYMSGLSSHWFHFKANITLLKAIMPNFSEAHLFDGDLVDVDVAPLHSTWSAAMAPNVGSSIQSAGAGFGDVIKKGVKAGASALRVGYTEREASDIDRDADYPDTYTQCGVAKGQFWDSAESSVVPADSDPTWTSGNEFVFSLTEGDPSFKAEDPIFIYVHMFENELGKQDSYLGQAKFGLDDVFIRINNILQKENILKTGGSTEATVDLTICDQLHVLHQFTGLVFPTSVSGSVTFKVDVEPKADTVDIKITLLSAADVGDTSVEDLHKHGEHDATGHEDDKHHSHGKGGSTSTTVFVVKNVKRWMEESKAKVEARNSMYEILLTSMRTHFIHDRESGKLSVRAFSRLNAALGIGFDMNQQDIDSAAMAGTFSNTGGATASRLAKQMQMSPEKFGSPLATTVNYIVDFVRNGLPRGGRLLPSVFFQHRLTSTEMIFALLKVLKEFSDADTSELGEEFMATIVNSTDQARKVLSEIQKESPMILQSIHTIICFKTVCTEYRHRVHAYHKQGFFHEGLVESVELSLAERGRELERYIHVEPLWSILGLISGFSLLKDHPVVSAAKQDRADSKSTKQVSTDATSTDVDNPVFDDDIDDVDNGREGQPTKRKPTPQPKAFNAL